MDFMMSVLIRIAFIGMMLLGLCFFVLLAVLSIARDLISNDHEQPDSDSQALSSMPPHASLQLERR
jgi:hypothetical protein